MTAVDRDRRDSSVGVLEIGGTHVVGARVDGLRVTAARRHPLDADADADAIVTALLDAAAPLGVMTRWGVAIPGPFDYDDGIGRFRGVAKFAALDGHDLGADLRSRLPGRPAVAFCNDAAAFGIGEAVAGTARGVARSLILTLGTGIGSAFMVGSTPRTEGPGVPPDGAVHHLRWQGRPLEDTVSRRGIRARHVQLGGASVDVQEIARLARADPGSPAARALGESFLALGCCLGGRVAEFGATHVVLGGSMARSIDLIAPPLGEGLRRAGADVEVGRAAHPETSALLGAALHAAAGADDDAAPGSR